MRRLSASLAPRVVALWRQFVYDSTRTVHFALLGDSPMATNTLTADAKKTFGLAFESRGEMPERTELPVRGEIPAWVAGQLLRNGPGAWKFDGSEVHHWFDGMALVHSFEIEDGRVHYMNRFVESRAYK